MGLIRINKFLSESGICSRRKADEHILAGKVKINREVVRELGIKVDPNKDQVEFDGKAVKRFSQLVYYAMNKPKGVVTTVKDEAGRQTVLDLVPKSPRVYPVGRLDKDSEGLLILTNDGEFANMLTHPSYGHKKEYFVKARTQPQVRVDSKEAEKKFLNGILIDGKLMKADKATVTEIRNHRFDVTMEIHTGYNRQVRKMCAKMDLEIIGLLRTKIGKLNLSELKLAPGEFTSVQKQDIV